MKTFAVDEMATACVQRVALALTRLTGRRYGVGVGVGVEGGGGGSGGAFFGEKVARLDGTQQPLWDAVSGDYRAGGTEHADWIRIHANFSAHRAAALAVANVHADADADAAIKPAVAAALAAWPAPAAVAAIERAGGCAARLTPLSEWQAGALHGLCRHAPLVSVRALPPASAAARVPAADALSSPRASPRAPLAGLRVLDLTRVLAGPTCTRILAAHGAQVLHVSCEALDKLPSLDVITGVGKRSCVLDLKSASGREKLLALIKDAHVFVQAYRPGSLDKLGLSPAALHAVNPSLIYASVSAYAVPGSLSLTDPTSSLDPLAVAQNPWAARRGFDSLVQMTTGICHEGMLDNGSDKPVPLPCQALDHATGWLVAAGILEAICKRSGGFLVEASLVRTSVWLESLGKKEHDDDKFLKTLDGLMEQVKVRGVEGRVLTTLKHPIRCLDTNNEDNDEFDSILGPPEKLGIDEPEWL
ncbi:hypothetical protein HK100_010712 [Physocladia obscura]|uniref:Uncharacterized protein n=1 Tax=Physocladia obscura TaxID=109957 RepID=A0AAD5T533_9FUNG|nr:hypothetical protein HK100_010712 [Physocladia obscura]